MSPLVFVPVPFCLLDKGNLHIPIHVDSAEWIFLKGARTFICVCLPPCMSNWGLTLTSKSAHPLNLALNTLFTQQMIKSGDIYMYFKTLQVSFTLYIRWSNVHLESHPNQGLEVREITGQLLHWIEFIGVKDFLMHGQSPQVF